MLQVTLAPKKKKDSEKDEKSEVQQPETPLEKVVAVLPTVLQSAFKARTASIKLGNMEYAQELANQLLNHAQTLEQKYAEMNKAVSSKSDEKVFKRLLVEVDALEEFGLKAQAKVVKHTHQTTCENM